MKIVLNKCYGGFRLSDALLEQVDPKDQLWDDALRELPEVIAAVEADADAAGGRFSKLVVVEIPDDATDWELNEYDGFESITYVLGGKLEHV